MEGLWMPRSPKEMLISLFSGRSHFKEWQWQEADCEGTLLSRTYFVHWIKKVNYDHSHQMLQYSYNMISVWRAQQSIFPSSSSMSSTSILSSLHLLQKSWSVLCSFGQKFIFSPHWQDGNIPHTHIRCREEEAILLFIPLNKETALTPNACQCKRRMSTPMLQLLGAYVQNGIQF